MSKINAVAFSASILTMLVLLLMNHLPQVPLWALFISWACFFHLGGGDNPDAAWRLANIHIATGIIASWLSALIVLANPFSGALAAQLWAPLVIGLAIGLLARMGTIPCFAVMPAMIYGYAGVWAFLSVPGRFDPAVLRSLTFDNVLIAMITAVLLGTCLAYFNARLVGWLAREKSPAAARLMH